eukprot:366055-Chlamydomonas_euryale.AAC.2
MLLQTVTMARSWREPADTPSCDHAAAWRSRSWRHAVHPVVGRGSRGFLSKHGQRQRLPRRHRKRTVEAELRGSSNTHGPTSLNTLGRQRLL